MKERLKELYKKVILVHNNEPFFFEKREESEVVIEAYNPLCGDQYNLFFEVKEGKLINVSFHGYGCAISKASTSVLVKKIQNQPIEKVKTILAEFQLALKGEGTDEELLAFSGVKTFPGRLPCATLSWEELQQFLKE